MEYIGKWLTGGIMKYKIIRASLIGIFIGISGALVLTLGSFMKRLYEIGRPVIETSQVLSSFADTESNRKLESSIIRFHVKANSDSKEDINLKYLGRDEVLKRMSSKIMGCTSMEESEKVLNESLEEIEKIAKDTIIQNGYEYSVKAYVTIDKFPMRQYGELVLPAGEYKALRVDIGEAKGENFWCLIYPAICYTSDSGAVLSREDGEELKRALSKEEYDRLFVRKTVPREKIQFRFKIVEVLQSIF